MLKKFVYVHHYFIKYIFLILTKKNECKLVTTVEVSMIRQNKTKEKKGKQKTHDHID